MRIRGPPRLLNLSKVNSWKLKGLGQTSLHLSLPRASSKFQHVWLEISRSPGYSYYDLADRDYDWVDHRWKGEPEMNY